MANYNKPTFYITEPHNGQTVLILNEPMRQALTDFVASIDDIPEPEIRAFSAALRSPHKGQAIRTAKGVRISYSQIEALTNAISTNWPQQDYKPNEYANNKAKYENDEDEYDR